MTRFRKYSLVFLVLMMALPAIASYKSDIYKAYITSDLVLWKQVIDNMEQQKPKTYAFIAELLNYQYGYIGWCVGNNKHSEAEKYITSAKKYIGLLEKKTEYQSLVNSYNSALYGFKIVMNNIQAPFLGPKSAECARKSIEIDSLNTHGIIQTGNVKFHSPAIFGGSKTDGIIFYEKALRILEKNPDAIKQDWNYLNLLTQIALAYSETGQYSKADVYFKKILKTEPDFKWVKEDVYPAFLKKHKA